MEIKVPKVLFLPTSLNHYPNLMYHSLFRGKISSFLFEDLNYTSSWHHARALALYMGEKSKSLGVVLALINPEDYLIELPDISERVKCEHKVLDHPVKVDSKVRVFVEGLERQSLDDLCQFEEIQPAVPSNLFYGTTIRELRIEGYTLSGNSLVGTGDFNFFATRDVCFSISNAILKSTVDKSPATVLVLHNPSPFDVEESRRFYTSQESRGYEYLVKGKIKQYKERLKLLIKRDIRKMSIFDRTLSRRKIRNLLVWSYDQWRNHDFERSPVHIDLSMEECLLREGVSPQEVQERCGKMKKAQEESLNQEKNEEIKALIAQSI